MMHEPDNIPAGTQVVAHQEVERTSGLAPMTPRARLPRTMWNLSGKQLSVERRNEPANT
jgi:hypothetical protein